MKLSTVSHSELSTWDAHSGHGRQLLQVCVKEGTRGLCHGAGSISVKRSREGADLLDEVKGLLQPCFRCRGSHWLRTGSSSIVKHVSFSLQGRDRGAITPGASHQFCGTPVPGPTRLHLGAVADQKQGKHCDDAKSVPAHRNKTLKAAGAKCARSRAQPRTGACFNLWLEPVYL